MLVSDGEETCDRDPCQVVQDLANQGVKVRIDTIGFRVDDGARKQLGCIASASGGEYRDASNAAELADSLNVVATRALKTYQTAGGVVRGGGSFNDAPKCNRANIRTAWSSTRRSITRSTSPLVSSSAPAPRWSGRRTWRKLAN